MLTDIHSHNCQNFPGQNKVVSIQLHPETNLEGLLLDLSPGLNVSIGVHPWHAAEWNLANMHILDETLSSSQFCLLGEIGLDNACSTPFPIQLALFEKQLHFAEINQISVLIHNVGHQETLMAMKKKYHKIPSWIIHGFRGKKQEAMQYLNNGFYLSFGPKYQVESLRLCPLERLFLETDDSSADLSALYASAAKETSVSVDALAQITNLNFDSVRKK